MCAPWMVECRTRVAAQPLRTARPRTSAAHSSSQAVKPTVAATA